MPDAYSPHHSQVYTNHQIPRSYQRHQSADNHYPSMRLPGYENPSPEFKRQKSDSMVVRGHDSHSQAFRAVDMEYSQSIREDAVPPHLGIMRANPRYHLPSGMTSMGSHLQNGDNIFRQPSNSQRQADRPHLKLDIPNVQEMYNRQRSGDFMSPSPTPSTPSTPLDQLRRLANDTQFQPHEEYHQMLKRREECLQGKASPYPSVPDGYPQQMVPGAREYVETMGNSNGHSNSKARCNGPPNTFPMRVKNSQQLQKSASVPTDMKIKEYRKSKTVTPRQT